MGLSGLTQPADHAKVIEENPLPLWRGAANILKRDKNFRWFLTARILSQFATMGFAFYIVYALRRFQMDAVTAGYLTATLTIAQTVANAGMGWLGDRVGHRLMLIIGAASALFSSALAWFAPSLVWFFPIFVLSGFANVSIWTNGMTMTVDFSSEKSVPFILVSRRRLRLRYDHCSSHRCRIADTQGFVSTFAGSAMLSIAMIGILIFFVKEPRKITRALHAQSSALPDVSHSDGA
jgi:MFS family permease